MESENPTCKCYHQVEIWEMDMQDENLTSERKEKYRYADQATLQISSNKFRISPCYSWNHKANMGMSNLFISQKVSRPNRAIRKNLNCCRRIHILNLRQHPITKIPIRSMHTLKQYLTTIQLQSPLTLHILLIPNPRIQRHLKNHSRTQNEKMTKPPLSTKYPTKRGERTHINSS